MTLVLVMAARPDRRQAREHTIPVAGWGRTLTGPSATERTMISGGLAFCIGLPVLAMVIDRPDQSAAVVAGVTAIAAPLLANLRRFLLEGDARGPRSTGVPL